MFEQSSQPLKIALLVLLVILLAVLVLVVLGETGVFRKKTVIPAPAVTSQSQAVLPLTGTIESIKTNTLLIQTGGDSPVVGSKQKKIVIIGDNTKISRSVRKSKATLLQETDNFYKNLSKQSTSQLTEASSADVLPPNAFNEEEIDKSSLQVGQQVTVVVDNTGTEPYTAITIEISDFSAIVAPTDSPSVSSQSAQ